MILKVLRLTHQRRLRTQHSLNLWPAHDWSCRLFACRGESTNKFKPHPSPHPHFTDHWCSFLRPIARSIVIVWSQLPITQSLTISCWVSLLCRIHYRSNGNWILGCQNEEFTIESQWNCDLCGYRGLAREPPEGPKGPRVVNCDHSKPFKKIQPTLIKSKRELDLGLQKDKKYYQTL